MLNRSILIVKPRQPFLDWLRAEVDAEDVTLEELRADTTAFLFPQVYEEEEKDDFLERFYDLAFEQVLWEWCQDEKSWPKKRSYALFKAWFDTEIHSAAVDLVDDDLMDDEFEEGDEREDGDGREGRSAG